MLSTDLLTTDELEIKKPGLVKFVFEDKNFSTRCIQLRGIPSPTHVHSVTLDTWHVVSIVIKDTT